MIANAIKSEFENQLLHTFKGKYVNPRNLNSWHSEALFMLFDERKDLGKNDYRQSPKILNPSVGQMTKEINKMASLQIGLMKPNGKFKELGSYDMEIHIPFETALKLWVQPNKAQEGKELPTNAPSYNLFFHGNRVGAMWSKISKAGDGFFSAQVYKKSEEGEKLNFNLFPIKKADETGAEIETGEYQANLFQANERDEDSVDHSPK